MYAYFRKLVYFSTECVFAPNAYRGHARVLLKDLEKIDPAVIMNIIQSGWTLNLIRSNFYICWFLGENLKVNETAKIPTLTRCTRCNYVSSQEICKACILLEGLNKGLPRLGIGKSSKVKRILQENERKTNGCKGKENSTCLCNSSKSDNKT